MENFSNLISEVYLLILLNSDRVKSSSITLQPKEAVILKSPSKLSTTAGYYLYYTHEEEPQHWMFES